MSDLIEKLQDVLDGKATFPTERLPEIIEQLKMVRGIEAAKRILIEWDEEVKAWRVNTYTSEGWFEGATLAAAVEAAGKKGEG